MKEFSKEIIKKDPKDITKNQYEILLFYFEYFGSEAENLEEFENPIKKLCEEIIDGKSKNVTDQQFKILLFYLDYFCPEIENLEELE